MMFSLDLGDEDLVDVWSSYLVNLPFYYNQVTIIASVNGGRFC